jgi:plastocyanin
MSREVRRRITYGIGIPVTAVVIGGALVFAFSRLLLASPEELAPFIALLFAVNILVGGALAAMLRSRWAYTLLAIVIIGTIVGGGVVGAVVGPRPIESLVETAEPEGPEEKPPPGPTPTAPEEKPPPKPGRGPAETDISAEAIAFSADELALAANAEVTITFENLDDGVPHNVAIYTDESGSEQVFVGEIITGVDTTEYAFRSPAPGTYFFRCDVHPTVMFGTAVFS